MKRVFIMSIGAFLATACPAPDPVNTGDDASNQDGNNDEGNAESSTGIFGDDGLDSGDDVNATDGMPMTDDGMDSGGSDGVTFITRPDGGGPVNECDQWAQDCPEGEKCMPWANDGGSSWNATKCSEVVDNPGQVGDECMTIGGGVSGEDTCALGSMCYYVDPESGIGSCVALCFGDPAAPLCDPGFACSISNDGVLTLCRSECDPLLQDCDNAACLPAAGSDVFVCIVDASGEAGAPGDECEFLNSCDPGNLCLNADAVGNGCNAQGCCSQFCDLTDADPDAACTQPGHSCIAYHEEGEAPPQLQHVGFCAIPA